MEFIETTGFSKLREDYLNDTQFNLLQLYLINFPDAGDVIRGSGGVRKLRWGLPGHGKRGGLRVVYYWMSKDEQILFLTVYRKTEAADLSQEAIREMRRLVKSLN
jgi:mRNA-degrading endonuclease RelE of RelBE toxin-antitoxin system